MPAGLPYGSLAWGLPFAGLLLTLAVVPLIMPALWHRHYGKASAFWSMAYLIPAALSHGADAAARQLIAVALHEYLPFVLVLGVLFVVAGGMRVTGTPHGTPGVNTVILAIGTLLASVIGTAGAAIVMVRPLIRANRSRAHAVHVFVFFIILVANVGGALSPLGDPPLFLGFLQGVPFFWPLVHLGGPTLVLATALLAMFYALDRQRYGREVPAPIVAEVEKLGVDGKVNVILLLAVVGTVMLRGAWQFKAEFMLFGFQLHSGEIVADLLLTMLGAASLLLTRPATRRANEFAWGPIIEVALVFAGIFVTVIPVIAMITAGPHGPVAPALHALKSPGGGFDDRVFFWGTGVLSAFLDNAPTYLVFFGLAGNDALALSGPLSSTLTAIAMGAVYFGALSYIGNAPNFMVKAVAESHGVRMPSFFGYVGAAAAVLLPLLFAVDVLFLR